jgi:hypothetical protein
MAHQYTHPTVVPAAAHGLQEDPPQPRSITALERLEHTSDAVLAAIAELNDYLTGVTRPAERRTVRFPNGQLRVYDQDDRVAPSVGFYNPNAFSVFAALGGEIPDGTQTGAFEITGNSFVVVPVGVQDLELGVRAADIGVNSALVHVFRYWSVQPAFFGAWK